MDKMGQTMGSAVQEVKQGAGQPLVEATSEELQAPEWRAHTASGLLAERS